jgi:glycosyltransferase involved in cell wall biosynthesis
MKILFIVEHGFPHIGGGETVFYHLSKGLVELGHEVTVLTSESEGGSGARVVDGVKYYYFPWPVLFNHALPKQIDLEKFAATADVVHTTTYTAALPALRVANKFRKPCLLTVHECLGKKWFWVEEPIKALLFYLYEQYVLHQHFDCYHAVSQSTKKDLVLSGITERRIRVIYNGIDPDFFQLQTSLTTPARKVFLYYGRDGKTKGLWILKKAWNLVKAQLPKEYELQILPQVEKKTLLEAIEKAYAVIIPSITEGFGFTAAESCAAGKRVIVSETGSLPEVVWGKVLFFNNRSPADLATKILLATKDQFQSIPKKEFSWAKAVIEIEKLYQQLLTAN